MCFSSIFLMLYPLTRLVSSSSFPPHCAAFNPDLIVTCCVKRGFSFLAREGTTEHWRMREKVIIRPFLIPFLWFIEQKFIQQRLILLVFLIDMSMDVVMFVGCLAVKKFIVNGQRAWKSIHLEPPSSPPPWNLLSYYPLSLNRLFNLLIYFAAPIYKRKKFQSF